MREESETILKGGRTTSGVVRIGNTVHRPIRKNSEFVHELLKLLEQKGFNFSPRFLGIDNNGREILSYIEGSTPHQKVNWTDGQLIKIAQIVKEFHAATQNSSLAGDKQVVCHTDIAPWNIVLVNRNPVSLIDFDNSAPGNRVDDLSYCLWTFLDIGDDIPIDVQIHKMMIMCEAYNYHDHRQLVESLLQQQKLILDFREDQAKYSTNDQARIFSEEAAIRVRSQIAWTIKNKSKLTF